MAKKNYSNQNFNDMPSGQKGNQGIIDAKRVTTKDRPNQLKAAFKRMIDGQDAKELNELREDIKGDTKSKGNGRDPVGGKGVTTDGSWKGWEHGEYDYDTSGSSHMKASKGDPKPSF